MCCILPVAVYGITFRDNKRLQRIRVATSSTEQTQAVGDFAVSCSNLVDKLLAIADPPVEYIDIEETEDDIDSIIKSDNFIHYNAKTQFHELAFYLVKTLIRRRSKELFGKSSESTELTDFLASALVFRKIMEVSSNGAYDWNYLPAREQFDNGFAPKAEMLMTSPVSCEYFFLFQIYAMHCSLLLHGLEKIPCKPGDVARRLLEMEAYGRSPEETVRFVSSTMFPINVTLQGWFEIYAKKASLKDRNVDDENSIEQRVKNLEKIEIVNSDGSLTTVKLDDVLEAFADMKLDKSVIAKRQLLFMQLRNDAPPLLKPPLELYAAALGNLEVKNSKTFARSLEIARGEFTKALVRQRKVIDVMDKAEKQYVPIASRYSAFVEVMRRYREVHEQYCPW